MNNMEFTVTRQTDMEVSSGIVLSGFLFLNQCQTLVCSRWMWQSRGMLEQRSVMLG